MEENLVRSDVEELENIIKTTKSKPECSTLTNILISTVDEILQDSSISRENVEPADLSNVEPLSAKQQNAEILKQDVLTKLDVQAEKTKETRALTNKDALVREDKCYAEDINAKVYPASDGSTPVLYYMKRLLDIQKKYSDVIKRRHSVHFFHETLRKTSQYRLKPYQHLSSKRDQSRLQKYASMYRPTASLSEIENTTYQEKSLIGLASQSFDNLEATNSGKVPLMCYPLSKHEVEYVDRNLVVKGVQKMPKPNPIWLFQKNGCDLSLAHLREVAKRLRQDIQNMELKWKKSLCRQNLQDFSCVGVDERLAELYKLQTYVSLEQQKKKENICYEVALCDSQLNTMMRDKRNEYFTQLYGDNQNPDTIRFLRNKTKKLSKQYEELEGLKQDLFKHYSHSDVLRKIKNGAFHLKSKCEPLPNHCTSLDRELILKKAGYSHTPVMAADYLIKTKFPKIFPKTAYSQRWEFELKTPRKGYKNEEYMDKEDTFEARLLLMDVEKKKKKIEERKTTETLFPNRVYLEKLKEKKIIDKRWEKILKQLEFEKETATTHYSRVVNPQITISPSAPCNTKTIVVHAKHSPTEKKNFKTMRSLDDRHIVKRTEDQTFFDVYPKLQSEKQNLKENIVNLKKNKQVTLSRNMKSRFPQRRCPCYVEIPNNLPNENVSDLYKTIDIGIQHHRLGLPDMALMFATFTLALQKMDDLDPLTLLDYAELLVKGLLHYPLQLSFVWDGVSLLLKIYNTVECVNKEKLLNLLLETFTTLLAIEDEELQLLLLQGICIVTDTPYRFTLSPDLIDFLLDIVPITQSHELVEKGMQLLCLGSIGHRKKEKYALFVNCKYCGMLKAYFYVPGLSIYQNHSGIVLQCCLSIHAYAQRAISEVFRPDKSSHLFRKKVDIVQFKEGQLSLPKEPVSWMLKDGSDIRLIFTVMHDYTRYRKVIGAVCSALCSLSKVSLLHIETLSKQPLGLLLEIAKEFPSSQCIALSVSRIMQSFLAVFPFDTIIKSNLSVQLLINFIKHQKMLYGFNGSRRSNTIFINVTHQILPPILSVAKDKVTNKSHTQIICSFLKTLCDMKNSKIYDHINKSKGLLYTMQVINYQQDVAVIIKDVCCISKCLLEKYPDSTKEIQPNLFIQTFCNLLRIYTDNLDICVLIILTIEHYLSVSVEGFKYIPIDHLLILEKIGLHGMKLQRRDIILQVTNHLSFLSDRASLSEGIIAKASCQKIINSLK
ncbi:uncharacterized protein LOC128883505 isoform X3 [Hylaeus volcanicus]|uniref:uncharacterized protein LOC128883505 isoform X3 n=1 Tax=Hylaeus volcanicus TaxID=313075 RepID=UPI0023B7897A|nr:uncharacterized protein LOC128883505 isoform X3 [Hylaeus volcanicus]